MPRITIDRQRFRNIDLVLNVNQAVNRAIWDESRYDSFLDELCGDRIYQIEAIKTALRYLLGGNYSDLRMLAKENYDRNPILEKRYGSWIGMERNLQLPNLLSATLDLATGTGKSYVLYGIAIILLAEGVVDKVIVLCPSTTIEAGLTQKFKNLASDTLNELLPSEAKVKIPKIINSKDSLTDGSICIENYHAILEHVDSSIRDSVIGKGERVAVLNDETHHVSNETSSKIKKWKEFLLDKSYGFRYVIGVSGTCYINNEYFTDVIYRYSLQQAMKEFYVKKVEYVTDMPGTNDPDEKWQLIRNRHEDLKKKLAKKGILPLTIVVTPTIDRCKDVADELKSFLIDEENINLQTADERILVVYNNAPDVLRLPIVDYPNNKVGSPANSVKPSVF